MQQAPRDSSGSPIVSVVMANFEAGERIVPALHSVLAQTLDNIEIIVSDDASRDGSIDHVARLMRHDRRIRLVRAEANAGPAQCRNRALDLARGQWIAIVDSDDIIHPERLERLLAAASHFGADIVADDLLLFFEDASAPRLLLGEHADTCFGLSSRDWILAGIDGRPAFGYLKPLIRTSRLGALRYDEGLRIGEDYDLVLRLLLGGAAMVVVPEPFYLYRRHSGSVSHRLSISSLRAMIESEARLAGAAPREATLEQAFSRRLRVLRQGLAYEELVASIKARRLGAAMAGVARNPGHLRRLWLSFLEGRRRRSPPPAPRPSPALSLAADPSLGASTLVPPYVPVAGLDWTAPRSRRDWQRLAASRGFGPVRCLPLDAAGRYAAGFIPEAEVETPEPAAKHASWQSSWEAS